jgi:hypothetical protein
MSDPKWDVTPKPLQVERPRPASFSSFGSFSVPGTRAGAVVSIGLVVIAWLAIPIAHPFLLGTGGLGVLIGVILWWKHNQ